MELTCAQMDVLISFYIDGDLSKHLKYQVENHLKKCSCCRAKYDIVKTMINDLKNDLIDTATTENIENEPNNRKEVASQHYKLFKNNLSAYIDNELTNEENIKIKKYTINNKDARKELEDCYSLRKLMNNSLEKTKSETKADFTRSVLKQLELDDEEAFGIHPAIKLVLGFTFSVMIISAIVLFSLTI